MLDMLSVPEMPSAEDIYAEAMQKLARAEGHQPGETKPHPKPGVDPKAILRGVIAKYLPKPHERRKQSVLAVLREHGPCTRKEIGAHIGEQHREYTRRSLLSLERDGLVCRDAGRPRDQLWRAVE